MVFKFLSEDNNKNCPTKHDQTKFKSLENTNPFKVSKNFYCRFKVFFSGTYVMPQDMDVQF